MFVSGFIAIMFAIFWHKKTAEGNIWLLEEYNQTIYNASNVPNLTITNPFDMKNLVYLPVSPEGATIDKKAIGMINYTLSDAFLIKGDPFLQSIDVWTDKNSIKAIGVTFGNGNTTITAKTFDSTNTTILSKLNQTTKAFPS